MHKKLAPWCREAILTNQKWISLGNLLKEFSVLMGKGGGSIMISRHVAKAFDKSQYMAWINKTVK